jgi:hypothetical protein
METAEVVERPSKVKKILFNLRPEGATIVENSSLTVIEKPK